MRTEPFVIDVTVTFAQQSKHTFLDLFLDLFAPPDAQILHLLGAGESIGGGGRSHQRYG